MLALCFMNLLPLFFPRPLPLYFFLRKKCVKRPGELLCDKVQCFRPSVSVSHGFLSTLIHTGTKAMTRVLLSADVFPTVML